MLKKSSLFVVILSLISSVSFAKNILFASDRLIVKIKKTDEFLLQNKKINHIKKLYNDLYIVYSSKKNLLSLEFELQKNPNIIFVQKDFLHKRNFSIEKKLQINLKRRIKKSTHYAFFNDTKASHQWVNRDIKKHGIGVEYLYANGMIKKRKNVIVAVVDTGIDYKHEDLKNRLWINKNEIAGNGIDDDDNGYIDDIHGINTVNRDKQGRATNQIMDSGIHGTHVSGLIAAEQNNSIGIAGIAKNVRIMMLKTIPSKGDEADSDVIESFVYAAKNGAKVVNCSFGKNYKSQAVSDTIKELGVKYDLMFIMAAGNKRKNIEKYPVYPANFHLDNMLVVGSTDAVSRRSYFSNYSHNFVDLFAPGSLLVSTIPGNKYKSLKGTSMAAPVVSAVYAELKAQFPYLDAKQIKDVLLRSVTKISSLKKKSVSGGIVNFKQAFLRAEEIR